MGDSTPVPHESPLVEAALGLDVVSVCSRLVAVLADAAHGWRIAADAIDDDALGAEMRQIAVRREDFAVELSNVVSGRSGHVALRHTMSGELIVWWIEIRAKTARGDTSAMLNACRSGSRSARAEYERALRTALPDPIREIVVRQADDVRSTANWLAGIS